MPVGSRPRRRLAARLVAVEVRLANLARGRERAGRRNLAYRFNLMRHIGNISTIRGYEQVIAAAGGLRR